MILGCTFLAIAIPFLIFLYGEKEREQLIIRYEEPVGGFLKNILNKREGNLNLIMKDNEVIMCAIGGYGSVDQLAELNAKQRDSLPKENLPSVDMAWYLLFFTNDSISRVYLIDNVQFGVFIDRKGDACASRKDGFSVQAIENTNGNLKNILNITEGMR